MMEAKAADDHVVLLVQLIQVFCCHADILGIWCPGLGRLNLFRDNIDSRNLAALLGNSLGEDASTAADIENTLPGVDRVKYRLVRENNKLFRYPGIWYAG